MNLRLLIDGIVQQTTVLLAQVSTASGQRSALSHVADQVFLDLARELEAQGVRRQVAADMFGLALRSYQKKVQRLTEGGTVPEKTLWEAVLTHIESANLTRAELLRRFTADSEDAVVSVLNDLLRSGLVFTTGTGPAAVLGATTDAVRETVQAQRDQDALENLLWVKVFRGARTREELEAAVPSASADRMKRALENLLESARLREEAGMLRSTNFVIPLGSERGWEAAVLDHFRAVAVAIGRKVRAGARGAAPDDRVGGSTFTFEVTDGHPFEKEVDGLLKRLRNEVQALWTRSSTHNEQHPPDPARSRKVTFYLGQTVEEEERGPE